MAYKDYRAQILDIRAELAALQPAGGRKLSADGDMTPSNPNPEKELNDLIDKGEKAFKKLQRARACRNLAAARRFRKELLKIGRQYERTLRHISRARYLRFIGWRLLNTPIIVIPAGGLYQHFMLQGQSPNEIQG